MTEDARDREWAALLAGMEEDLREIEGTRMPFGKYGPNGYPPAGLLLYELPAEYLGWFEKKGAWPKGRLGELMRMVHQMKVDGSEVAFEAMRARAGGRRELRAPKKPGNYHFGE